MDKLTEAQAVAQILGVSTSKASAILTASNGLKGLRTLVDSPSKVLTQSQRNKLKACYAFESARSEATLRD